jgi:hypothetical protein
MCHPVAGEGVYPEDGRVRWPCKRRNSFVSGVDVLKVPNFD